MINTSNIVWIDEYSANALLRIIATQLTGGVKPALLIDGGKSVQELLQIIASASGGEGEDTIDGGRDLGDLYRVIASSLTGGVKPSPLIASDSNVELLRIIASHYTSGNLAGLQYIDETSPIEIARIWASNVIGGGVVVDPWEDALFHYSAGDSLSEATFSRASTASYRDVDGVLQYASANEPRDSHYVLDPVTETYVRTLLLEGASTNLFTNSQNLTPDTGYWNQVGITVAPDATVSPDGNTSWKFTYGSGSAGIYQAVAASAGVGLYSFSAFFKAGTTGKAFIRTLNNLLARFDVSTGVVTDDPAGVECRIEEWPNGWYRCSISGVVPGAIDSNAFLGIDGASSGEYLYVVFPQFELIGFTSSYIPTTGVTATRAADSLTFPFPYPPQELSEYVRLIQPAGSYEIGASSRIALIGAPTFTDCLLLDYYNSGTNRVYFEGSSGSTENAIPSPGGAGDSMEWIVGLLGGVGSLTQSINGDTPTSGATADGGELTAWSSDTLHVGSVAGGGHSFPALRNIVIAKGTRDLSYFRNLFGYHPPLQPTLTLLDSVDLSSRAGSFDSGLIENGKRYVLAFDSVTINPLTQYEGVIAYNDAFNAFVQVRWEPYAGHPDRLVLYIQEGGDFPPSSPSGDIHEPTAAVPFKLEIEFGMGQAFVIIDGVPKYLSVLGSNNVSQYGASLGADPVNNKNVSVSASWTIPSGKLYRSELVHRVVLLGDSMTEATDFALALYTDAGRARVFINLAAGGNTMASMTASAATATASYYQANAQKNLIVIHIGVNDLVANASAASLLASLQTIVSGIKASNPSWIVALVTLPDFNNYFSGGATYASANAQRIAYNSGMSGISGVDLVIDEASIPEMSDSNDTAYFTDKVHNTPLGYRIRAAFVANAISDLTLA